MTDYPQRIVCLTEETTETLYALGEQDRIVGISGFTVRPAIARKEKPKVSAFTSAKIDKILALKPDLVLGFSDLQGDIARDLIKHGVPVYVFNQRSVTGILSMILQLGGLIGCSDKAEQLVASYRQQLKPNATTPKPVVYFEEWDDPIITGIGWVSELIEIAGGVEAFPEKAGCPDAKSRIVANPYDVVTRQPDIIIGSWCGKKFRPEKVAARPGWHEIPAVINGCIVEIKSCDILQPGPAALTDGLAQLRTIIGEWSS